MKCDYCGTVPVRKDSLEKHKYVNIAQTIQERVFCSEDHKRAWLKQHANKLTIKKGTLLENWFREIVIALNKIIENRISFVSVKRVRGILEIDADNRCMIFFIWKFLSLLELEGYISLYSVNGAKKYRLPSEVIDIQQCINQICEVE